MVEEVLRGLEWNDWKQILVLQLQLLLLLLLQLLLLLLDPLPLSGTWSDLLLRRQGS